MEQLGQFMPAILLYAATVTTNRPVLHTNTKTSGVLSLSDIVDQVLYWHLIHTGGNKHFTWSRRWMLGNFCDWHQVFEGQATSWAPGKTWPQHSAAHVPTLFHASVHAQHWLVEWVKQMRPPLAHTHAHTTFQVLLEHCLCASVLSLDYLNLLEVCKQLCWLEKAGLEAACQNE